MFIFFSVSIQQPALNEFLDAVEKQMLSSAIKQQDQVKLVDDSTKKKKIATPVQSMPGKSQPTNKPHGNMAQSVIPRLEQWIVKQPEAIKRLLKLGMEPSSVFTITVSGFDNSIFALNFAFSQCKWILQVNV